MFSLTRSHNITSHKCLFLTYPLVTYPLVTCLFSGSPTSDLDLCVVVHPALAPLAPSSSAITLARQPVAATTTSSITTSSTATSSIATSSTATSSSQLHGLADALKAKLGIAGKSVDGSGGGSGGGGDDMGTGATAVGADMPSAPTAVPTHPSSSPTPPTIHATPPNLPNTSSAGASATATVVAGSSSTTTIISDSQRVLELHGKVSYAAQSDIINKIHTYIVNTPSGDFPRVYPYMYLLIHPLLTTHNNSSPSTHFNTP